MKVKHQNCQHQKGTILTRTNVIWCVCVPNRHLSAFGAALLIPILVPLQCLSWRLFNPNLGAVNLDPNAFNTSDPNISPHITIQRVRSESRSSYPTSSNYFLTKRVMSSGICSRHVESRQAIGIRSSHANLAASLRHWREAEMDAFEQTVKTYRNQCCHMILY